MDIPKQEEAVPTKPKTTPAQLLLEKDMTRKEFMATLALSSVSILGFGSIIHFLTGHKKSRLFASAKRTHGYGSSPYGGK